ncbi:MAG: Jag N-terminal domain-containing protein [Geovibrio sp.]|nr:Jag N-terminal domain-containing protein [Geovibrio sp.]
MRHFEIEGRTAEEALDRFLAEKGISKDFVEYEVIEQGSKGFLGFGSKPALIKVKFDDGEFLKRRSKLLLSELLEKAGFSDFSIEVKEQGSDIILNIKSEDSSLLIGKTAQTLDSFQYILDKMLKTDDRTETGVVIDVEDYRLRTVKQFKEKAVRLAKNAVKTGKTVKLPPNGDHDKKRDSSEP